jgi:hypothetical protein
MFEKSRTAIPILALILAASLRGQVVFSRRVYQAEGRSYQQLWSWNPVDGALTELTHSSRDHFLPTCTDDKIAFVSPRPYEKDSKTWSFDRTNGQERKTGPAPAPPDREPPQKGCSTYAKAGGLEACGGKEDISISRSGTVVGHFHIPTNECPIDNRGTMGRCETPVDSLEWSPNARWLLVEERGLHTNSTFPQADYYVVDAGATTLRKAASATEALWLPQHDELLFTLPRELEPLPGGKLTVWVQHLMLFDPATGKNREITSGVSNNLNASWCGP